MAAAGALGVVRLCGGRCPCHWPRPLVVDLSALGLDGQPVDKLQVDELVESRALEVGGEKGKLIVRFSINSTETLLVRVRK